MTQPEIKPEEFIITRKRKKYKFAKFALADNCFEAADWDSSIAVNFIEVGAGTGLFSVELARRHPDKVFVALDVKADRLQKGAYQALEQRLPNIYFIRGRADQLAELFPDRSLDGVWLTFPDPYPKKRSAGRRLTHLNFLNIYEQLLGKNGQLYLKHDNEIFFKWSLEQLVATGWQIRELSFDLHESDLADDYKVMTTYEQRWLREGRITQFVKASPKSDT